MGNTTTNPVILPVRSVEVGWVGGPDHDVLHVAPGQVRVGLQRQGDDGGGHGGAGAGPRVLGGAFVVEVRRHDLLLRGGARAVRGGDGGGAGLRVPGDVAILTRAGHGDGVDGGRVSVTVAVILQIFLSVIFPNILILSANLISSSIATGPNKY